MALRSHREDIQAAINAAAEKHGLSSGVLTAFAHMESSGRPDLVNGRYRGLFQLGPAEFNRFGTGNIMNPVDNANAAAKMMALQAARFTHEFKRAPTTAELYMIHQQGEGGSRQHWRNPDAPAWQNMAATREGQDRGEAWAKSAIKKNLPTSQRRNSDSMTSRQFLEAQGSRLSTSSGLPREEVARPITEVAAAPAPRPRGEVPPRAAASPRPVERPAAAQATPGVPPRPEVAQAQAAAGLNIQDLPTGMQMRGTAPRNGPIEGIILHHTGPGDLQAMINTNNSEGRQRGTGYHYYIQQDGSIVRAVPENMTIGHVQPITGRDAFGQPLRNDIAPHLENRNTIGIGVIAENENAINAVQRQALQALVQDRAVANPTVTAENIRGHGEIQRNRQNTEGALAMQFRTGQIPIRPQEQPTTTITMSPEAQAGLAPAAPEGAPTAPQGSDLAMVDPNLQEVSPDQIGPLGPVPQPGMEGDPGRFAAPGIAPQEQVADIQPPPGIAVGPLPPPPPRSFDQIVQSPLAPAQPMLPAPTPSIMPPMQTASIPESGGFGKMGGGGGLFGMGGGKGGGGFKAPVPTPPPGDTADVLIAKMGAGENEPFPNVPAHIPRDPPRPPPRTPTEWPVADFFGLQQRRRQRQHG